VKLTTWLQQGEANYHELVVDVPANAQQLGLYTQAAMKQLHHLIQPINHFT